MADAAATLEYDVETSGGMDLEGGEDGVWGRLTSLNPAYPSVDLRDGEEMTFGRASLCGVQFEVNLISGNHCRVYRDDAGVVFVKDTSSNGTFVNGKKVGKDKTALLQHGDVLGLMVKQKDKPAIEYVLSLVDEAAAGDSPHAFVEEAYTMGKVLGRGNFANVYLGVSKSTGEKVAIKAVDKGKFLQVQHREGALLDEVNILKFLEHGNIIKLHETFESDEYLYLVLELVTGGELFDMIVKAGKCDEDASRKLFLQLLDAVSYMHEQGIAHRDLKPENILLAAPDDLTLKISDFGLSRILGVDGSTMGTVCGTPQYVAPEILNKSASGYNVAVDMWSLGVILYAMLSGMLPFDDAKPITVFEQIQRGLYSFPSSHWGSISEEARDLIRRLMQVDPSIRWTAKQAASHPWCQGKTMTETPIPAPDSFKSIRTKPVSKYRGRATTSVMVKAAISAMSESSGSSPASIAAYIAENYTTPEPPTPASLAPVLASLVKAGALSHLKSKGTYKLKARR